MIRWLRRLFAPRCAHEWRGVANYYDADLGVFIHLRQCSRCLDTIITGE